MALFQTKVIGTNYDGDQWNNIFHYDIDPFTGSDAFIGASLLNSAWMIGPLAAFSPLVPADSTIRYIATKAVGSPGGATALHFLNQFGGAGSLEDVVGVSGMVRWVAGNGARGHQGRTFLPGLPIDAHVGNFLTPTYNALIAAFVTTMLTSLIVGADSAKLSIFHRTSLTWSHIDYGEPAVKLGAQRKRMLPLF